jgi:nicotinamidase-related amidase
MTSTSSSGRPGRYPRVLDPRTTAVVCVECQRGVLGAQSIMPALAADAADSVASIATLVTAARAAGALVVHATFQGWLGITDFGTAPLWRVAGSLSKEWRAGHPDTEVLPELLEPEDLIIPRHQGLSPTWGTELLPVLHRRGVKTIVLAGVSLNVALPLAAGEAMHEGFAVIVPSDAAIGTPREYGEMILKHTISMIATVTTVDGVVAAWAAAQAGAQT